MQVVQLDKIHKFYLFIEHPKITLPLVCRI